MNNSKFRVGDKVILISKTRADNLKLNNSYGIIESIGERESIGESMGYMIEWKNIKTNEWVGRGNCWYDEDLKKYVINKWDEEKI